jgi:hypothetical protein
MNVIKHILILACISSGILLGNNPTFVSTYCKSYRAHQFLVQTPDTDTLPVYDIDMQDQVFYACVEISEGDSVWFQGRFIGDPGFYQKKFLTQQGTDSVFNLLVELTD